MRTRVDGEIQQVAFREGQTVHKGDILVQVDPRPYQATYDQAKAKKEQDTANLNNAKADLVRYTGLGAYASRQQTETQTALVAQLTAQVAADQAAIDNAATQLGYATIRAPIDGVTGFRQVDIGNIVNASGQSAIVTITQVEPIFVVFTAPEDQLPAITAALRKGDVPVEAWSTDGLTKLADGKLALLTTRSTRRPARSASRPSMRTGTTRSGRACPSPPRCGSERWRRPQPSRTTPSSTDPTACSSSPWTRPTARTSVP